MSNLKPIFLSASIPDRPPFNENVDPLAIREAVLALVAATVRKRELVFGGHPAISPLVDHASRTLKAQDNVWIYQSRFFEDKIPEVSKQFKNLVWTEKVDNNKLESLTIMRREMIGSRDFDAAVFIGGMEGIFEECEIFKELHPQKILFPIASTLGAAKELYENIESIYEEQVWQQLNQNKHYRALFRTIMSNL
ncbi:MAG: hypothetical protein AAF572_10845 [Cyanobacteria bacterium P01_B01_bin.77]